VSAGSEPLIHIGLQDVYVDGKPLSSTLGVPIAQDDIVVTIDNAFNPPLLRVQLTLIAGDVIFGEPSPSTPSQGEFEDGSG
jgi:hypothetical protein